jgi:hypothetical protein
MTPTGDCNVDLTRCGAVALPDSRPLSRVRTWQSPGAALAGNAVVALYTPANCAVEAVGMSTILQK